MASFLGKMILPTAAFCYGETLLLEKFSLNYSTSMAVPELYGLVLLSNAIASGLVITTIGMKVFFLFGCSWESVFERKILPKKKIYL